MPKFRKQQYTLQRALVRAEKRIRTNRIDARIIKRAARALVVASRLHDPAFRMTSAIRGQVMRCMFRTYGKRGV